ncbi:MAG: hypothetical protein QW035_00680 [Candidatus Anstonellales archaeon]
MGEGDKSAKNDKYDTIDILGQDLTYLKSKKADFEKKYEAAAQQNIEPLNNEAVKNASAKVENVKDNILKKIDNSTIFIEDKKEDLKGMIINASNKESKDINVDGIIEEIEDKYLIKDSNPQATAAVEPSQTETTSTKSPNEDTKDISIQQPTTPTDADKSKLIPKTSKFSIESNYEHVTKTKYRGGMTRSELLVSVVTSGQGNYFYGMEDNKKRLQLTEDQKSAFQDYFGAEATKEQTQAELNLLFTVWGEGQVGHNMLIKFLDKRANDNNLTLIAFLEKEVEKNPRMKKLLDEAKEKFPLLAEEPKKEEKGGEEERKFRFGFDFTEGQKKFSLRPDEEKIDKLIAQAEEPKTSEPPKPNEVKITKEQVKDLLIKTLNNNNSLLNEIEKKTKESLGTEKNNTNKEKITESLEKLYKNKQEGITISQIDKKGINDPNKWFSNVKDVELLSTTYDKEKNQLVFSLRLERAGFLRKDAYIKVAISVDKIADNVNLTKEELDYLKSLSSQPQTNQEGGKNNLLSKLNLPAFLLNLADQQTKTQQGETNNQQNQQQTNQPLAN